jgi:hypothetical protein
VPSSLFAIDLNDHLRDFIPFAFAAATLGP